MSSNQHTESPHLFHCYNFIFWKRSKFLSWYRRKFQKLILVKLFTRWIIKITVQKQYENFKRARVPFWRFRKAQKRVRRRRSHNPKRRSLLVQKFPRNTKKMIRKFLTLLCKAPREFTKRAKTDFHHTFYRWHLICSLLNFGDPKRPIKAIMKMS